MNDARLPTAGAAPATSAAEGMTWKPSEHVDQSVREWIKAKDWEVTRTNYDFGNREGFLRLAPPG